MAIEERTAENHRVYGTTQMEGLEQRENNVDLKNVLRVYILTKDFNGNAQKMVDL